MTVAPVAFWHSAEPPRFAQYSPALDMAPEELLALAGVLNVPPEIARDLTPRTWLALRRLAAAQVEMLPGDAVQAEFRRAVAGAAARVTADMRAAHGAGGCYWRIPPASDRRPDRYGSPLLVPTWWGALWAARYYQALSARVRVASGARAASRKALALAALLEDWTMFWLDPRARCRAWAVQADFDRAFREYERAQRRVGPPSLLVLAHDAVPGAALAPDAANDLAASPAARNSEAGS